MRLNVKFLFGVISLLMAFTLSSCHKHKKSETTPDSGSVSERMLLPGSEVVFPETFGQWESLEVPVTLGIAGGRGISMSGKAYFVKDSELLVSLRMLGFEVGQLYANTDSVFFVDKYHKIYISEPMSRLSGSLGLTLGDLQGYLLGRPVRAINDNDEFSVVYNWDGANATLLGAGFLRSGEPVAGISYENIVSTPDGPLAGKIEFAAALGNQEFGGSIIYRADQAKRNSIEGPLKFSMPGREYKRVSAEELAKSI